MDITRRELVLVAGGTLTASLRAWITADPAAAGQLTHGKRIGEAAVARIEDRVRNLRRTDDADGGGIITETSSALDLVAGLLRAPSYTDAHGRRLYATAADLAYDTALRAAHIAVDIALDANVLRHTRRPRLQRPGPQRARRLTRRLTRLREHTDVLSGALACWAS